MNYRLFKYRSLAVPNRGHTSRIITERRIYYAAPRQLNDPFDCDVCVRIDGEALSAQRLPVSRAAEIRAYAEQWLRAVTNNTMAVLSLCRINDDVQMWSHYADGHAGICLEFTFEATEPPHEVRYTQQRPSLDFGDFDEGRRDHERFARSAIELLTTKAPAWSHEKELRCIDFDGPGERPMPSDMLTGVIFGCRIADGDKEMVRNWVRSSGQAVRFYQANQRDGSFALDIQPLD